MRKLKLQLFSVVDTFKNMGMDSSYENRKKYYEETMGLGNYTGSAEQNIAMEKYVKSGGSPSATPSAPSNSGGSGAQNKATGDGTQLAQNALNSTFTPSSSYQNAMKYTNSLLEQLSSGRTSYTDQVKSMMDQIQNREDFEYDMDSDMLFQQYLASSMATGKQAMQHTIGQASALTGGYGSSYATSAGNQMYNAYIQDAMNNLPEYYQLALEAYEMEGREMYNQLAMLNDADATEYNRLYNAWNANNSYANQLYQNEYTQWADGVSNSFNLAQFMNSNYWKDKEFEFGKDQYLAQYDANGDGVVNYEEINGNKPKDYDTLTEPQIETLQKLWYKHNGANGTDEEVEKATTILLNQLGAWGKHNVDMEALDGILGEYKPPMWEERWEIEDDTENGKEGMFGWWGEQGDDHNDIYTYNGQTKTFDELKEMVETSGASDVEIAEFLEMLRRQSKQ